jgi:hypothetical protein
VADETSIEFSEEELLLIDDLTGLGLPVGLGDPPEMPTEVRSFLLERARKTLTDRGVLDGDQVHESVRALVGVSSEPGIVCSCAVERERLVDTTFLMAIPELAVEHSSPANSVHRLTPFLPRDLLVRLFRVCDLRPARASDAPGFEAQALVVEEASSLALNGSLEEASRILSSAGVSEDAAAPFIDSMRSRHATVLVTVLHKPSADVVEGGQLTWIDCGISGLWKVEAEGEAPDGADAGSAVVRIEPITAEDLAAELLTFLPGAFEGPPADASSGEDQATQSDEGASSSS